LAQADRTKSFQWRRLDVLLPTRSALTGVISLCGGYRGDSIPLDLMQS